MCLVKWDSLLGKLRGRLNLGSIKKEEMVFADRCFLYLGEELIDHLLIHYPKVRV